MQPIDPLIKKFIKKHHVLTLATCSNNQPWCASCFYAWDSDENIFVFTTDFKTRHGTEALKNKSVAANILLETSIIGKIKGLQIIGKANPATEENLKKIRKIYLKRFPYAIIIDLELWTLEPEFMKLTDNNLGFGKKLIWER